MYRQDLAQNNIQWLIYPKAKPNQTKSITFCATGTPSYLVTGVNDIAYK